MGTTESETESRGTQARADLHVHSRHSDRPSEWILRRMGAPECFVSPHDVYEHAMAAGMDFVTITDHNSIDGALEIADRPDTFVSCEVTTYFPEDTCKVHVLVFDLTESQFRDIQSVREDIYQFRDYLGQQGLAHSVAHPLFAVNERLTVSHLEKLLLLFKRFEVLNGTRHSRSNSLLYALLANLTPAAIDDLANTHGIEPTGPSPHVKAMTGGSDDHSGRYVASAHTVTPAARSTADFVAHLRQARHQPDGRAGTSLRLAHSFYHIAYSYYRDRFLDRGAGGSRLLEGLLKRMVAGGAPPPQPVGPVRSLVGKLMRPWKQSRLSDYERSLVGQVSQLFEHPATGEAAAGRDADERTFEVSCRVSHQLGYHFIENFLRHLRDVSLLESLQTFASLAPLTLSITPYLAAFRTQHKDDVLLPELARRFAVPEAEWGARPKKAWVTDTFEDVNGVVKTIRTLAGLAKVQGRDLTVLTCLENPPESDEFDCVNFAPVGMFELPEYQHQKLAFPPFLDVIEYLERGGFGEVIISTPGPMGLTALAAARLLELRTTGIYHTDFPQYVQILTDDVAMSQLTWRFMIWFYGQMDLILAPSEWYRENLRSNGLDHREIAVLPRGIDLRMFSDGKRNAAFWHRFGCNGNFKFLYVGRVSKEKNVEHLLESFGRLLDQDMPVDLAVVGDGPLLPELKRRYRNAGHVVFTGFLQGEELAQAYASADAFVFPSSTDTFGNVVLEAQASGLPAVVSDKGGPQEIVRRNASGMIVDMEHPTRLAEAMAELYTDRDLRASLAARALENARNTSWPAILDALWEGRSSVPDSTRSREHDASHALL